jgi:hypothetical protein
MLLKFIIGQLIYQDSIQTVLRFSLTVINLDFFPAFSLEGLGLIAFGLFAAHFEIQ